MPDAIEYGPLINNAIRGVIRKLLIDASVYGVPHPHQFCITFLKSFPGVKIEPPNLVPHEHDHVALLVQNPAPSTVSNYEASGIHVTETWFCIEEHGSSITVPFSAIIEFYDPAADFRFTFAPEAPPAAEVIPFKMKVIG